MMHRYTPRSHVVRCLFPVTDLAEQARVDNSANILQESIKRDRVEKMKKWNFDFEKDVPLKGSYEWFKNDGSNNWIGMKVSSDDEEDNDDEQSLLKLENEATPRSLKVDNVPLVRKRRNDGMENLVGVGAKRKINFD